jgi:hypothetical protein
MVRMMCCVGRARTFCLEFGVKRVTAQLNRQTLNVEFMLLVGRWPVAGCCCFVASRRIYVRLYVAQPLAIGFRESMRLFVEYCFADPETLPSTFYTKKKLRDTLHGQRESTYQKVRKNADEPS